MKNFKLTTISKEWGFEKVIINNEKYCGKLLYFLKDKSCSWHYHKIKDETLYVQKGKIILYFGYLHEFGKACQTILSAGDHFNIPVNVVHKLKSLEDTELFEFSNQDTEEDIFKINKGD